MSSTDSSITAILIHVSDIPAGIAWYQLAFPAAHYCHLEEFGFDFLSLGDTNLEIVPADEKVASGACGTIVYWHVPDFNEALQHFQSIGATLYRGPMKIEDGQSQCQIRDLWGNCIGLWGLDHGNKY
jgi:predicted enzyme related to lactoylglutathione lyase